MAEPQIKAEHVSPSPQPESSTHTASLATAPTTTIGPPLWKKCEHRPRVEQVNVNEEAAEHSNAYFTSMKEVLSLNAIDLPACHTRLQEIG